MSFGGLEKATIRIINGREKGTSLECAFNPSAYTVDNSVNYGERGAAGTGSSVAQFVDGNAQTLSMELFFDTSEDSTDVRQAYTQYLDTLLSVDDRLQAPPACRFVWGGGLDFTALLERARKQFTKFEPDGTPVRARVDVVFRAFEPENGVADSGGANGSGRPESRRVTAGKHLWALAAEEYGDPTRWREIADRNGVENPRRLVSGQSLEVP